METLSNPILLILGGILLAVMINLFLVTFAKGKSKRSDGNVVTKMLKAAQAPYKETNENLEELARLIEDEKLSINSGPWLMVDDGLTASQGEISIGISFLMLEVDVYGFEVG